MNILHISDDAFTDQNWQTYYSLIETLHKKYNSPAKNIGWEKYKETVLSLCQSDPNYHRFVILDQQAMVGWADFFVRASKTPEQNASIRVDSIYENTPAEFTKIVAEELLRLMERYSINSAHMVSPSQRISAIARSWFSKELNRLDQYGLVRKHADTSLMESWLENIPRSNRTLRLKFFSPIPEKHLAVHTKLFVSYINEMPTEQETKKPFQMTVDENKLDMEWRRKNNIHVYTYALFDPNENMIGHSNAIITEADPSNVYQAMTGINREYRGRGLSRWLKASLFFKIGEDFPGNKTMTTDMRAINAPIQKVNTEMGYVLQSSGNEFEISVEGLRKLLDS